MRWSVALLGAASCLNAGPLRADPSDQLSTLSLSSPPLEGTRSTSFAIGPSVALLQQRDFAQETASVFIPGFVGVAYVPVSRRLYLRPGVRMGYVGLTQTASSAGAKVTESGFRGSVEAGLLYDGWLIPAVSVGAGVQQRQVRFEGRGIVEESALLDQDEVLGFAFAQLGLGLPLFHSVALLEPYARLQYTLEDDRSQLQVGWDLTFAL